MNILSLLFAALSIVFISIDQLLIYAFIPGIIGLVLGLIAKKLRQKNTTLPIVASIICITISLVLDGIMLYFYYVV